jgi:5'-3' exonuclease
MLIADLSQLAYAVVYAMKDDIKKGSEDEIMHIIRNGVLSMLRSYKKKFREQSGNMVVACDGNHYWRYDIFPHYKSSRKEARKKDDMPWELIKPCVETLIDELSAVMPYRFIRHDKAEADDVIAILVEDVVNKTPIMDGLEEGYEPVLLVNKDKDIQQLLKYNHVRMFSPYTNQYIQREGTAKEFLRRMILCGDAGDSVPNVFSPEDSFVTKTRQKPATEAKMKPFLESKNMLDATDDEQIKKRMLLNMRLISFDAIPPKIRREVVEMYNQPIQGSRMALYQYLVKNRCDMALDKIEEF